MNPGWNHDESPFHTGEQALQERAGVRGQMENFGRKVVRDYLPEQHRKFFEALPYVFVGSVDDAGRPWASILTGSVGFIESPAANRLTLSATPLPGDPLAANIRVGAALGLLGLEFSRRRRNRVNGRVTAVSDGAFELTVDQAFGNCPKYIQARSVEPATRNTSTATTLLTKPDTGTELDDALTEFVSNADTFFIATVNHDNTRIGGADVSHRGGSPGFVRVDRA
ncbi:MAG: pyridoxamine 5'-phosphate oxidase family protein, partial [Gammaproteobacteria bacterium]|nr:pyridoxamine 5'-phosphate oxidase family protein [Gammaproteobacteria bacterium]